MSLLWSHRMHGRSWRPRGARIYVCASPRPWRPSRTAFAHRCSIRISHESPAVYQKQAAHTSEKRILCCGRMLSKSRKTAWSAVQSRKWNIHLQTNRIALCCEARNIGRNHKNECGGNHSGERCENFRDFRFGASRLRSPLVLATRSGSGL